MSSITPEQLNTIRSTNPNAKLIDVRSPAEFEEVHAAGAINIPLDVFKASAVIAQQELRSAEPVYLICKMGGRSQKACDALRDAGFANAINVTGGTDAWVAAGAPAQRGQQQAFSIQRQVQILAGSLALIGALLSFVNPLWAMLSAFIGAGLVFSGLTNTCAMGNFLAAMPWNQVKKAKPASSPAVKAEPAADCDTGG